MSTFIGAAPTPSAASSDAVFVISPLRASEIQLFRPLSNKPISVKPEGIIEAVSGIDNFENLFVAPAFAGSPLLEFEPPYDQPPAHIEQPANFGDDIIMSSDEALFVAGDTLRHSAILVYTGLYAHPKSSKHVTINLPYIGVQSMALDAKGDLFVAECCRGNDSFIEEYARPYVGRPIYRRTFPGIIGHIFVNKHGDLILDGVPYRTHAALLAYPYTGQPSALCIKYVEAKNSKDQLFGFSGNSVLIYDPPYTCTSPKRISFNISSRKLIPVEVKFDAHDDLFVLTLTRSSLNLNGQFFDVVEFAPPYGASVWESDLHQNPDEEASALLVAPPQR